MAAEKAKKASLSEGRVSRFYDSVHNRGANRITQQKNYDSEMLQIMKEFPGESIKNIFGTANDEYLEARKIVEDKYVGKLVKHIVSDNGEYIYSKADIDEYTRVKVRGY